MPIARLLPTQLHSRSAWTACLLAVPMTLLAALTLAACGETPTEADSPDPPDVADAIENQTIEADAGSVELELSEVFTTSADEPLTYDATSSPSDAVNAFVDEATLIVEPLEVGTAAVTVEAENEGGTAETNFQVEVILPDPPDRP